MLGVLFLALAVWTGFALTKKYLPGFLAAEGFPPVMTALPAAFTIGVIASGVLTYALCLLFAHTGQGILYGAALAAAVMAAFSALTWKKTVPDRAMIRPAALRDSVIKSFRSHPSYYCVIVLLAVFVGWVFRHCFFYEGGSLFVGYSVFSDFGPHVAVIRSFSVGNNFPAQYPHYPDGSMLYHFMFMFYTGVLESLGLRIDHAFNGLSFLSLMCCLSLLYVLAVKITGKPAVGALAVALFLFRSSFAAFTFLFGGAGLGPVSELFSKIIDNRVFIGNTPNEVWGLWNINVYANQRHLGFGMSLIFLLVIALLPLYEGRRFRDAAKAKSKAGAKGSKRKELDKYVKNSKPEGGGGTYWLAAFFKAGTWGPRDYKKFVFLGLLTGAAAYFHGSCVVAALGVLAVMALFSREKLGFALLAGIALVLTSLQNSYFSAGAPVIAPGFQFGFIAADKSVAGVAKYLAELTGIVFPVALAGAVLLWRKSGGLFLAFLVPAVFTFTLSLTPDITVNHKYLMISIAMLNIFAAYAIAGIAGAFAGKKRKASKALKGAGIAVAGLLVLVLTVSGILDIVPYSRQSGEGSRVAYADTASETVAWIAGNTAPGSVFLSHWHVQSPVLLAGRFEYMGWPYFGWSAGYDTYGRRDVIAAIFAAPAGDTMRASALASGASYIFVDMDLIDNAELGFSEEAVAATFPLVFTSESENIRIYWIV